MRASHAFEKRVKDLKLKLERLEPEMDMGSAISTKFGAFDVELRIRP